MIVLSKAQILSLHKELIERSGGTKGILNENLLDSALSSPFQTFENMDLYPTIIHKAARLSFGLVSNHAFIDGNKRIAVHAMLVFLELNNIVLIYSQEDLSSFFIDVASGNKGYDDIVDWIIAHQS